MIKNIKDAPRWGTRHFCSALHVDSNAASGHGQLGNRLGRSSWLSLAIERAAFGQRQPNIPHCHAELVSASHETLKQVQGDDKGGVQGGKYARCFHVARNKVYSRPHSNLTFAVKHTVFGRSNVLRLQT